MSDITRNIIRQYQDFRDLLERNPYDEITRRVFADFLEEQGLDDEAVEQRAWTLEKQQAEDWLKRLAFTLRMDWLEFLRDGEEIAGGTYCFSDDYAPGIMRDNWREFCRYWQIYKGKDASEAPDEEDTHFRCAC